MSKELIPLNFGLWWSGSNLSYLRYMTFATLRHFHPNAKIQLYVGTKYRKDGYNWGNESFGLKQEFQDPKSISKNYLDKLKDIDVEVIEVDLFSQYPPNYQSDFFRWWWLQKNGGFYMDVDVIVLKSFESLPLTKRLIYCGYSGYYPVGVIGAKTSSKVVEHIVKRLPRYYNPDDYNSCGPYMFRDVILKKDWNEGVNAPSIWFYPIAQSNMMPVLYRGDYKIPSKSYALHWFGGLPASQKFNARFTPEFAKTSEDALSTFLRDEGIVS